MSEKKYPIITIARQYAAYGRTIAGALSERLGIPYYDKDFVKKTAEESGYTEEDILKEGESMTRRSKWMNSFLDVGPGFYASDYDGIFNAQRKVIVELSESPCIIVGRCANYVLQSEQIPSFDIYLYADLAFRLKRARELSEFGEKDVNLEKFIINKDIQRKTYYKTYTGRDMEDLKNYNLCLDVGAIGVEKSVEIIENILRSNIEE